MTRYIPTPKATDKISTKLGIDGTCSARTCKSGSEIVIINPMIKLIRMIINTFLELYTELACLVLLQRSSILQFQLFATCLTEGLEKSKNKLTQKRINQLLTLQERYIAFQNQLLLFEVSPQEQAVDLYKMWGVKE